MAYGYVLGGMKVLGLYRFISLSLRSKPLGSESRGHIDKAPVMVGSARVDGASP